MGGLFSVHVLVNTMVLEYQWWLALMCGRV